MNKKKVKILLTGGGSGGHIYPLIAVSEELQRLAKNRGAALDLRYIGDYGLYKQALQECGIRAYKILGSKLRRYFSLNNLFEAPKLALGFIQAFSGIAAFKPDVVFSKGGSGALPVIWAASILKIPVVVHESDSVPGITSLMTAKFAGRVAVSFPSSERYFPGKAVLTGNPVRGDLLKKGGSTSQEEAKRLLGFDSTAPLLFFVGGSQGAIRLNKFVTDNIGRLTEKYQVFHQTGRANYDKLAQEGMGKDIRNYKPVSYLDKEMGLALRAADLIVSRAGGSIFEIAAFGKPSILIPLPEAAQNHQLKNAEEYAKSGAAVVMEERNLNIDRFLSLADNILSNAEKRKRMSEAAGRFSKPNAALSIAETIYSLVL